MLPELKPDEQMLGEGMLLKPCDTTSNSSAGETLMFTKPCDSVSESLPKKRPVDTTGVEGLDLPRIKIEEGLPLDIKALLSSKDRDYLVSPKDNDARVPISSLHGKYVIVCGFPVPIPNRLLSSVASDFRVIQALYTDLSCRGIADDVKLVVVVKCSPGFTNAALHTLFSRIPVNCLTVPLSDSRSLHYLCESLCYFPNDPSYVALPHLIVNPSGIVLKHSTDFLRKYGPLSFPFSEPRFRTMDLEAECLKHQIYFSEDYITVEDVFGRKKLAEIGNEMNVKSTKELDNAIVGIYLYSDGEFMDKLQDIHQKCVEKDLRLDIILVPLPFHTECDPTSFYELMKQHALKYTTSSSWLAFPFDDKISRAFWRMFMCREEDQLIILQHDDHPGELFGKQVASSYGADAYPFSRAVVAERKLSELRSFTVESFLEQTEWSFKKNVLFHIDYPINDSGTGLGCMLDNYPELQAEYPDIQEFSHRVLPDKTSGKSVAAPADDYYTNRIFMKGTYVEEPVRPLVVVFGEDGKIVSRHEDGQLRGSTTPANLFRDTLKTEILADIKRQIEYLSAEKTPMFLEQCNTLSKRSTGDTQMFLKPCDSLSESLAKKRRVDTLDVDKMDSDEEPTDLPPIKIELGQPLDIKALLSTKHRDYLVSPNDADARVPISSLHAKYVLVCGFAVPVEKRFSRVASELRAIEALYAELSRRGIADDVKLVIVVKPSPGFTVTEADLRTFFSRIPVNCLTVPLSDSQSLHFLYKSLGYIPNNPAFDLLPHLVVNPSGIVLQHCSDFLLHYGPLSFPFTLEHFHIVGMEDKILEHQLYFSYEPRTVKRLLRCEKLSEIGNEMKSKSTDELDNTPVGIYLYFGGEFMDELQDIHQKCVEKGLKFEIVLVPMPFYSESDPASFYELMKQHALKYSTTSSWLAFPFDDKICRSLWHISMLRTNDQLIILQHDNWCGELFGKKFVSYYGIDAYPFNRKVVVDKKFSELRSLTADSLLSFTDDAPTKHVLLQIDYAERGNTYLRHKLPPSLGTFTELKGKYPDIVDIFFPIRSSTRKPLSFDEEDQAEVMDLIFMKGTYVEEPVRPLVVVFGEDGKIVSRHEDGYLRGSTTHANLFNDTLRAEILYDLRDKIDTYP